jgi:hypothetical protein
VAIDVFNAQDTDNRRQGAGFPWTLVITPDERTAFDWIRTNTPAKAIVQVEPFVRDPASWAYVPAFAERRMFAGLPISMIPRRGYELASQEVYVGIFRAGSAEIAHGMAVSLGVNYIVMGDPERGAYPAILQQLQQRPDLFEPVFHNDAIQVFRVV